MWRHAVCWQLTDDSEVFVASIISVTALTDRRNIPEDSHIQKQFWNPALGLSHITGTGRDVWLCWAFLG
jgi:hypothetical protein